MKKIIFLALALCGSVCTVSAQAVYRHLTTTTNTGASGGTSAHITVLDHPQLNGTPDAMVFITTNWGTGGTGADYGNNVGVWYNGTRWTIFNQNTKLPMPLGISFNVMVVPKGTPGVFRHTVTAETKAANGFNNGSQITTPLTDGKDGIILMVTQCWTGTYNDNPIQVANGGGCGLGGSIKWAVTNGATRWNGEDYSNFPMPLGASFNIMVIENGKVPGFPSASGFTHVAKPETIIPAGTHISFFDRPDLNAKPEAIVFVTPFWGRGKLCTDGPYVLSPTSVWYDHPLDAWKYKEGYWSVYYGKGGVMPPGSKFNVVVVPNSNNDCLNNCSIAYPKLNRNRIKAYEKCMTSGPINGSANTGNQLQTGTVLLYKTNDGRFGKMEILEYGYNIRFRCQTYAPNGSTFRQNSNLTIRGTWSCDLDKAIESNVKSDFLWQQMTSTERQLMPKNGAKFWVLCPGKQDSIWAEIASLGAKTIDTASLVIEGLTRNGAERLPVAVVDGNVVFDGDIVIGPESEYFTRVGGKLVSKGIVKGRDAGEAVKKDAGTPDRNALWPNGIVPFEIEANHPRRNDIMASIEIINRIGSVCLRPRNNEADFVAFTFNPNDFPCVSSWVGRRGGRQTINILNRCAFGTIQHEILHAIGVFHEHTRADRDDFIRVNWANIQQNRNTLFQYRRVNRTLSACGYDYGSIMHYGLRGGSFAINNDIDVLTPLRPVPQGVNIGQRDHLSPCDVEGVRFLYAAARGCAPEDDPDLITFIDQPNFDGFRLGYEQQLITPTEFPQNYIGRPISIDIMNGWVAIITMECNNAFPLELRLFADEPNITLPGPVCRIEMVRIAEERILNIPNFGRRCPTNHAGGDQEFGGNGPAIFCSASILRPNGDEPIKLRVSFTAKEIGGDGSLVRDFWESDVMTIEQNLKVLAMDRYSSQTLGNEQVEFGVLGFRSRSAGPDIIGCNEGQVHTSGVDFQLQGNLIREMQIVGDTGHVDINSGNCGCDTGIRNIIFNPVRVFLGVR